LVDTELTVRGGRAVRVYPRTLPDLFVNDEIRVTGRLADVGRGPLVFTVQGRFRGEPVRHTIRVNLPRRTRRPWVGKLWAQSRVDHLLEQNALDGSDPERQNEIIDLSLAYNFVTPFTAFLAIPKNEATGEAANMLASARARKKQLLEKHRDAQAVHFSGGDSESEAEAVHESTDLLMSPQSSFDEGVEEIVVTGSRVGHHGAGCASCTVGATGSGSWPWGWTLAVLGAVVLLRRRRR
jgi:MYXO-CTERM domain-containing protein